MKSGLGHMTKGFHYGFWSFANTEDPAGMVTCQSSAPNLDAELIAFLNKQRDKEIKLEQYSDTFGMDLLPGMTAQPIFTTPKKGSAKLHLVNDYTAGPISLNSLILAEGSFMKLDTLSDLVSNI